MSFNWWATGKKSDIIYYLEKKKSDPFFGDRQAILAEDIKNIVIKNLNLLSEDDVYFLEVGATAQRDFPHRIFMTLKLEPLRSPRDNDD
jgi:hypothetical protein